MLYICLGAGEAYYIYTSDRLLIVNMHKVAILYFVPTRISHFYRDLHFSKHSREVALLSQFLGIR